MLPMNSAKMVFHFDNPIEFLNIQFRERQKAHPRFSLRAWARQMGYQNPSLLFQVLRGERRLKMDLAKRLAADLGLTGKAQRYFEVMVLNHLCQTDAERRVFAATMSKLRPKKLRALNPLAVDIFAMSTDWCHGAILAMSEVSEFKLDLRWIQKHLTGTADKKSIQSALERLVRVGLLIKRADGTYVRAESHGLEPKVAPSVAQEAIRKYQEQMIEKAKVVAAGKAREDLQMHAALLSVKKRDLPKVERILLEAQRQILEIAAEAEGENVYQFNSQFFKLSKVGAAPDRTKAEPL